MVLGTCGDSEPSRMPPPAPHTVQKGTPMSDEVLISPSILSADILHLGDELDAIETADFVHIDVMDAHFVPVLTFGPNVVRAAKRASKLPLDVHLMVSNPDEVAADYLDAGADVLGFHLEAATHAHRIVSLVHERGAKACVTINPGTPVCALDAILGEVDMVLVMTVDPGYGGQSFIPSSLDKLRELRRTCDERGVSPLIEVDGGVSAANAEEVVRAGARVLVAGSAVYKASDRAAAIAAIREAGRRGLTLEA